MASNPRPRRNFLKAVGISMALPLLESKQSFAQVTRVEDAAAKRLVCVGTYLGFHQDAFFPKQAGFDYETSELLKPLESLRDHFTVFSGLDHRAGNGHGNWGTFLTGQKVNQISLDQIVAEKIGQPTRFDSIQLSAGKVSRPMNYTREGIALPMIARPSVLYKKLFASPDDLQRMDYLMTSGQSALDTVLDEAKRLQRALVSATAKTG